jgi:hypothetical protein
MSEIGLLEDLRELTLAELDEVAGGAAAVGVGMAEAVSFSITATGPNASVSGSVNIATAVPTSVSRM